MNDGAHSYQYDAEGNVLQVDGGTTASYVYDAFNRRIAEQTPSGTHEFNYDYAGRRISGWLSSSNYGDQGRIYWNNQQIAFRAGDGTNFDHQDTLGTERMRTLYDGSVGASYQSLPWGDGYTATVNNSYAGLDSLDFAGLERDVQSTTNPEEDTEHAQFRNYAPAQGRWLSPDRYLGSYDFANPQSLNRYAYVLNNPTSFTDPSGLLNCKFGPCASPAPGCDDGCPPASPPSPSSGDPGCWSCGGTPGGGGGGGGGQPGNQQIYTFSKTVYSTWLQNFDLQLWILTSVPFSSSSGQGVAPNNGFNNNEQISNCLSSYYNSKGGKILEFGSLLSMVPGWDPEPGKNILENIFLMGGKLIGLKGLQTVGQAGIQSAVSGTATSIASPLENLVSSGAGKALGAVGAAGPIAVGGATLGDIFAHGACTASAYPTPSIPSPF